MHRILIVSDEEFLRDVIRLSLADMQADVRCASDVPDMQRMVRRMLFDLVVVVGTSAFFTGCDVVRTLRPAGLGRPLVYVVAWQQAEQTVLSTLGVRRRPVHDLSREPSAIADEDRQRLEPTVMTETLLMLYAMFAAAGTFALLSLLGAAELHARRRRCRDAALRAKYLRIVMLYPLAGEGPAPRFPMIRRAGARLLLVETVAGLAGVTYGLDAAPLRRIVAEYGLDAWLLRRTARSRGYRRARCLLLLSRLPVGAAAADCAARYAACRNRYVRFQSLMVRLAADPSTALRLMAEYPEPFSACEVGEIMAVLRRGMLPIAYEPLIGSPSRNLRIVGLNIVRQFGIEEAERLLLRIVSGDEDPELVREALYTLCALRRPLTRRAVSGRLSAMPPAERKALLRYVVAEGYSPGPLRRLLDERERPYYESLVQTYKRSLA